MMRHACNLRVAWSCTDIQVPRPISTAAKNGLRYERNVFKALKKLPNTIFYNPQYYFSDDNGPGYCIPDILLVDGDTCIVIECKLTYTEEAIEKLRYLYCPVVSLAMQVETRALVIVKHLTRRAPEPAWNIKEALQRGVPLLHWLGKGPITWAPQPAKFPLDTRPALL
jgi:Holliday junction resolvase